MAAEGGGIQASHTWKKWPAEDWPVIAMEFDCSKARSEQNSNGTFRFGQDEGTDQAQCALTLDLQYQPHLIVKKNGP